MTMSIFLYVAITKLYLNKKKKINSSKLIRFKWNANRVNILTLLECYSETLVQVLI